MFDKQYGPLVPVSKPYLQLMVDGTNMSFVLHIIVIDKEVVEAIPMYVEELLLQLNCWVECTT